MQKKVQIVEVRDDGHALIRYTEYDKSPKEDGVSIELTTVLYPDKYSDDEIMNYVISLWPDEQFAALRKKKGSSSKLLERLQRRKDVIDVEAARKMTNDGKAKSDER